jgi:hypothetical protein
MVGGDNENIIITSVKFDSHTINDLYTVHFKYDKHEKMDGIANSIKATKKEMGENDEGIKRKAYIPFHFNGKKYNIYFKFSELETMYKLVDDKCKEGTTKTAPYKYGTKVDNNNNNKTDIMGHCDVTRSMETFNNSNTIKFDMKSSINIQKGVDVFMKIENFGSAHPAMVSLHYCTDGDDNTITKLDDDDFYIHFIEDADKNYNFKASVIKFIIALYVDSLQKDKSKMRKNPNGGTKRGGSTRKLYN